MTVSERRSLQQQLAGQFPGLELHRWYIQYRELKASQPDAVLLYRLGDFYEAFDDDAKLVAELFDVTLTSKEFASDPQGERQRCPMSGMPYHAVESYIARLVGAGYRVAIAEQMSETATSRSDTRPRSRFAAGIEPGGAQRGMVERQIVRVITPGTVVDAGMLADEHNLYLCAVLVDGARAGLAYADLSTGEFAATEFHGDGAVAAAAGELARLQPAEILVSDVAAQRPPGLTPASAGLRNDLEFLTRDEREVLLPADRVARRVDRANHARWAHGAVSIWPAWHWESRTAREAIQQQFAVTTLAGFGLADRPLAARAAGALLQYAHATQAGALRHLTGLRAYDPGSVMFLDPPTRRNLELLEGSGGTRQGSLVAVLDQTRTPMGARLLRRWIAQPLLERERIMRRHDAVAHFLEDALGRAAVREALRSVGDIERIVNRVLQGPTVVTPRDLVRLRDGLRALPALCGALRGWTPAGLDAAGGALPAPEAPRRRRAPPPPVDAVGLFDDDDALAPPPDVPAVIDPCAATLALLERALDDQPPALLGASDYLRGDAADEPARRVVRPGFEPQIDEVVRANRDAQQWIAALEPREQERTGIRSLRVAYNKVFGYYLEVPRSAADRVPEHWIRKQTLTSGERYVTEELKTYEEIVSRARERLVELERQTFGRICAAIAADGTTLLATARALAAVDVVAALAEVAAHGRYCRPTIHDDARLRIRAGRHPVVERTGDGGFVPNDLELDPDARQIIVITGANMTGKSTLMRQVALIVLLAQIGAYVPADAAEIGIVDRIFTRIGAQDDIATGQSTFMVEMSETAAILAQATRRSLIVLDEVGRGTSTYDGMAIARAVLEYVHDEPRLGCRTLFATHYHELTLLEAVLPRLVNAHMAAVERAGQVVFLHTLRPGGADRSYGIHVAALAGVPPAVIRRARTLLAELERRAPAAALPPAEPPGEAPPPVVADPLITALSRLEINELTPLEALNRLYEYQRVARMRTP
jgi:DNA mismatch repair protein MutS